MGSASEFLFISLAVNFGLILFTLCMIIIYRLFYKESGGDVNMVDEVPVEQEAESMEEVPIEL